MARGTITAGSGITSGWLAGVPFAERTVGRLLERAAVYCPFDVLFTFEGQDVYLGDLLPRRRPGVQQISVPKTYDGLLFDDSDGGGPDLDVIELDVDQPAVPIAETLRRWTEERLTARRPIRQCRTLTAVRPSMIWKSEKSARSPTSN